MKDKTPIYPHSVIYAREHDELPEYRASFKAHTACRDAIDAAISEHYRNNSLSTQAIKDVVAQFGFDRTLYVLANTVQHKDWDGRISNNNASQISPFCLSCFSSVRVCLPPFCALPCFFPQYITSKEVKRLHLSV